MPVLLNVTMHHPECYGDGECACGAQNDDVRLYFFPFGIADARQAGSCLNVTLTCGCVIVYAGKKRLAQLTKCWEHDGYWPMVDAARWTFAVKAHWN